MAKDKVAIVTDSTTFLPHKLLEQYRIHVIPLNLHWGQETQLDVVDITPTQFYERLQRSETLPTTSQPSAGRFLELFRQVAETADSIVTVLVSSELSGTVASAYAAMEMMEEYPIELVDTRSVSVGVGLIALAAARAAALGWSTEEVARVARDLVPHTHVLFAVDTLEYLHRGGRIGGAKRFLGSVLAVKPLLHLEDGKVEPLASVRTKSKAVERMLDIVAAEAGPESRLHMATVHASAPEEGKELATMVRQRFQPVEMIESELSPVVGVHGGPGTVGVGFYDGAVLPEALRE